MKNPQKKDSYPCRAYIVRVLPATAYSDSIQVQACAVVRLENPETALCEVRIGGSVEVRSVPVSDLASSQAKALAKITLGLHSLAARAPLPSVAVKTAVSECNAQSVAA